MPIYEFYCSDCHTVFSFLSRQAGTRKRPSCPRCAKPKLERRPSAFAVSTGRSDPTPEEPAGGADPKKLEQAMAGLAAGTEHGDEDNPRAVARLMRRFLETSGAPVGNGMDEALSRLAAGENPDEVEADLGELLEAEDAPQGSGRQILRGRAPRVDGELHEL